jgi:hypothetical protein
MENEDDGGDHQHPASDVAGMSGRERDSFVGG